MRTPFTDCSIALRTVGRTEKYGIAHDPMARAIIPKNGVHQIQRAIAAQNGITKIRAFITPFAGASASSSI